MEKLKDIFNKVEGLIKVFGTNDEIIDKILEKLFKTIGCYIIIIDENNNIINKIDNKILNIEEKENCILINKIISKLNSIKEPKFNVKLSKLFTKDEDYDYNNLDVYNFSIVPINILNEEKGSLVFYKEINKFLEEDIIILEIFSLIIILILSNKNSKHKIETVRKKELAKNAIDTLSYSELESIVCIFDKLQNNEGIIIASKIADIIGVAKSVIVNGLRKLESAGIIESRSLGMKGTFLKILNKEFIIELNKIKN